jgi:hypothetical protein
MLDKRGVWDTTMAVETSEGGLGLLFQMATNACFGYAPCRNVLAMPGRFSAIKTVAIAAKKNPRKAIGKIIKRVTPVLATAIDGASLVDHYKLSPINTATSRCAENHHGEDKEQNCAS